MSDTTTKGWNVIRSTEDSSVNFVQSIGINKGMLEARYVQRPEDLGDFVCYLSSDVGCSKSCRMCHLTSTGQIQTAPVTRDMFVSQADIVLRHASFVSGYKGGSILNRVKFDFMARGEPLSNKEILSDFPGLARALRIVARQWGYDAVFNVSTIMPNNLLFANGLTDVFQNEPVRLFYSLYSTQEDFRRQWLPKALNVLNALYELSDFRFSNPKSEVILHWPFIAGQNDSEKDIESICYLVEKTNLASKSRPIQINIVRFNSPDTVRWQESSDEIIQRNFALLKERIGNHPLSKIVSRVGVDCKASCGMFVKQ